MISFTIKASILKTFVEFIRDVEETTIKIDEAGISMLQFTPSHISAFKAQIPSDLLEKVEGTGEIGIDISNFERAINSASNDDEITVESKDAVITVKYKRRKYQLGEIDVIGEQLEWPNVPFTSEIGMNSKDFMNTIKEAGKIVEFVKLDAEDGIFRVSTESDGIIKTFLAEPEIDYASKKGHGTYNIEMMPRKLPVSTMVIELGEDVPLQLKIQTEEEGIYEFILAPRVDREQE